jgi:NAD-dependent dihydropyrimidine dehydrogenase PreA subunit
MGKDKPFISFDDSKCSVCSTLVCVGVCPQGILEADAKKKPHVIDVSSCTFCGVCVNLCPMKAVTINAGKTSEKSR